MKKSNDVLRTTKPLGFIEPSSPVSGPTAGIAQMLVYQDLNAGSVHFGTGRPIAEVTAKHESNPRRLAALKRARARLAGAIEKETAGRRSLTEMRLAAGLSQKELAERTGMLQPQIARLEAGAIASAGANTIRKLRDALGVSADEILDSVTDADA